MSESLHDVEWAMRLGRKLDANRIAAVDLSVANDDAHDASFAGDSACFIAPDDGGKQARLKAIDLYARIPESCKLHDRLGSHTEARSLRQFEKSDAERRDIFAQLAGRNGETGLVQFIQQFRMNEMDLPQVRLVRIARDARAMFHRHTAMRVAFNAFPTDQPNRRARLFAE